MNIQDDLLKYRESVLGGINRLQFILDGCLAGNFFDELLQVKTIIENLEERLDIIDSALHSVTKKEKVYFLKMLLENFKKKLSECK